jgi:quinone-modifying oxidoreductase subunit QmoC
VVGFLIDSVFGVNWLDFRPHGSDLWQANYFSNYLVDIIMVPTFFAAIGVFALGLKRFLADIHANAVLEGKTEKENIDPAGFVQALIKIVPTILKHNRFNECGENKERATSHMMVLYGFIGLAVVTGCFFLAEWVFHIEGPYNQINPIKWLGNAGGLALIIGSGLMIGQRLSKKDQGSSYKDWYLLVLVFMLGLTGMLTQLLRLGHIYGPSAFVYYLHIIFVWALFAYTPFSKLAHLAYRTVAMAYQEYSGRK